MKSARSFAYVLLLLGTRVPAVQASPTMIRLGYGDCATCHISPQGGGLLTTYGKGVDEAQSFRQSEVQPVDTAVSRFLYDVRFVMATQLVDSLATSQSANSSTVRLLGRSSLRVSDHNRISYAAGFESPTMTVSKSTATSTTANLAIYKALWE